MKFPKGWINYKHSRCETIFFKYWKITENIINKITTFDDSSTFLRKICRISGIPEDTNTRRKKDNKENMKRNLSTIQRLTKQAT